MSSAATAPTSGAAGASAGAAAGPLPRRLELSTVLPAAAPTDPHNASHGANDAAAANGASKYAGTLCTAPLSTVLVAATDALHADLADMCRGEIEVTRAADGSEIQNNEPSSGGAEAAAAAAAAPVSALLSPGYGTGGHLSAASDNTTQKKEKMASLSFAQRRHELASRLARHSKSVMHCATLVGAYGYNDPDPGRQSSSGPKSAAGVSAASATTSKFPRRGELAHLVSTTSRTLQYVSTSTQHADETQDALYFVHDDLWKQRGHVQDVRGALEVVCGYDDGGNDEEGGRRRGRWSDFPRDAALNIDRYSSKEEASWSEAETVERLRTNVRRKLLGGEVGVMRTRTLAAVGEAAGDADADDTNELPWRIVLEKGGGAVRLVHGTPRKFGIVAAADGSGRTENGASIDDANGVYPMEARLTVLAESDATAIGDADTTTSTPSTSKPAPAPWTLLSIQVAVSAKTGEDNHQLNLTKKQMFDLHRLCVRSMTVEEAQTNKLNELEESQKNANGVGDDKDKNDGDTMEMDLVVRSKSRLHGSKVSSSKEPLRHPPTGTAIARPLSCLYDVAHSFAASLHLQMISAQAQALQKGAWSGSGALAVTPVHFFEVSATRDDNDTHPAAASASAAALGCVAIHFWTVDDRNSRPALGDLALASDPTSHNKPTDVSSVSSKSRSGNEVQQHLFRPDGKAAGRLTLCMRAVAGVGVVASLSAGDDVIDAITADSDTISMGDGDAAQSKEAIRHNHLKRIVSRIVTATSSPFDLSASDALLAATTLCAERRCEAAAEALEKTDGAAAESARLPSWLKLVVECGTISVGAKISYFEIDSSSSDEYVELFRLECESKTGKFIPTFSRDAILLRMLSCNDSRASELQALSSSALAGRRAQMKHASGDDLTGRTVREAFDALARAMSLLGERVGVGGTWVDTEASATSLRARAVETACRDMRKSLVTCAGIAAIFGLSALALKVSSGVEALVDVAGGPIKTSQEHDEEFKADSLLGVPPVGIVLNQQVIQEKEMLVSGEEKTTTLLEKDVLAVTASAGQDALTLYAFNVTVQASRPSLGKSVLLCLQFTLYFLHVTHFLYLSTMCYLISSTGTKSL